MVLSTKRVAGTAILTALLAIAAQAPAQPAATPQQANEFIFKSSPLDMPRAFGGMAVMGDYLYYFGGSVTVKRKPRDERPSTSAVRAQVLPDGKLGPWAETTPLPEPRHYIDGSTLVLNDVVYIVGGSSRPMQGERFNTAIYSRPLPNGTLLPWSTSKPFGTGEGLSTITAISTPGHIHVIGGLSEAGKPAAEVWTNAIYADGSMGEWSPGPPLPFGLWYHSAGVASGRVYVWGGLPTGDVVTVSPRVLSAPILGSGRLGDWRAETVTLPQPFYGASSSVAGNYLLSFGPRYSDGGQSDDIWYSVVTPAGLSQWRTRQAPIPNKRFHASAADFRKGMIFFAGGRKQMGAPMLVENWYFQLGAAARQSAEQTWLAHQRAHLNTVAAFGPPGQGGQNMPSTLAYIAASKLPTSATVGFKTYDEARTQAAAKRQPLVAYFHVEGATPCVEQVQQFASPEFAAALPKASWAWVETKDNPQLAQQLGVYRVPTWIFYDGAGNEIPAARTVGVKTARELAGTVAALK